MPSQLYNNDAVEFICGRSFVYNGEQYTVGESFPQEAALNIETLVRTRHIIPVVEDWADKPRHWHREIRLKSEVLDKLHIDTGEYLLNKPSQIDTNRPDDIEPGSQDLWEETEDNGAELLRKQQRNIDNDKKDEENDMGKHEVTYVNGNEESEPVALLGLSPEEAADAEVETKLEDEPEVEVSDDIQKLIDKKSENGGETYNPEQSVEELAGHQGIVFNEDGDGSFDPNKRSVAEVNDHLESADDEEKQRVLNAEKSGKNRKGIVGE